MSADKGFGPRGVTRLIGRFIPGDPARPPEVPTAQRSAAATKYVDLRSGNRLDNSDEHTAVASAIS
jgi:hypothetical protein